ncbi:aminopeptidase precursor, vacuolar [Fusarium bulbicola]|nr:aminopeptidase precursor, vacuolar [Fusarium bulbicola]
MRFSFGIINILSLATSHGLAKLHKLDSEKLQADIKASNLIATLDALNDIAFTNGGNRAFGLPGYQASVEYIYTRISKVDNAKIWKQTFPALFTFVESIELNVDNKAIDVYGLTYSPSTTKMGITAEIALGPEGAAGCDTSSYDDSDVKGKIVLVRNFPCRTSKGLAGKVISVAAAGGSAVIIYDDPMVNVAAGSLGRPNPGKYVPAGFISHSDALKIKDRIEAGETVKAHFQQTQIVEERLTQNIIAETTTGDPHNVIMLGAHLDSVQDGPGINDNGSGSALILELYLALSNYKTKNKIRFAWWGAEENGLLGSKHYTSTLSADDIKNLLVYLNFDMVSRGFFGVADTDGSSYGCKAPESSEAIEKTFVEYFTSRGIETTPVALTNGSDYAPFWQSLGKSFGFLHTVS